MNKYVKHFLLVSMLMLTATWGFSAMRSRTNLKINEQNLDILADKEGSLNQLIGELQGFDVIKATSDGSGSVIVNSSVGSGDTVAFAMVMSSANTTRASSTTILVTPALSMTAGAVTLTSKVLGMMGNNIKFTFLQIASTNSVVLVDGSTELVTAGSLYVNTTGYAIDVHLSTHGYNATMAISTTNANYASCADVCSAIQNDAGANELIDCSYSVTAGTRVVSAIAQTSLNSGTGSNYFPNVIDGSFFTCGAGTITIGNNTPISANDGLFLYIYKRPED